MRRGSETAEVLMERVARTLRRHGYRYAVIGYPPSRTRCIDIVAWSSGKKRIFIRIAEDAADLSSNSIKELRALSSSLNAAPVVVASRIRGVELEDYIIYEKYDTPTVTATTLEEALREDGFYVWFRRGEYYVKVDPEKLRSKRLEKGLSLGDIAYTIGVSRKTIYEYERGSMDPTLPQAEKLVNIFGEDIMVPVNLFRDAEVDPEEYGRPHSRLEGELLESLRSRGYRAAHASRAPLDIAASREGRSITIVVKHGYDKNIYERSIEVVELAETIRAEAVALVDKKDLAKDLEGAGIRVYRFSELRGRLVDLEGGSDNG